MSRIYLVRNEADKNMNRFYQLIIMPGLFGDWSLIREWGRIGSPGTVRKDWFDTEEEAISAAQRLSQSKQKGGYHMRLG